MMAAGGDLGGSKIDTQIFDAAWARVDVARRETPRDFDGRVAAVALGMAVTVPAELIGQVGLAQLLGRPAADVIDPGENWRLTRPPGRD
ncbi:hypothetical protein ACXN5S_12060 [Pseudoroseicyclus sp. H15]